MSPKPARYLPASLALLLLLGACTSSTGPSCSSLAINGSPGTLIVRVGQEVQLSTIRQTLDFSSEGSGGCIDVFDDPSHFIWSSSNNQVASVDAAGLVRGLQPGTATITANGVVFPYQFPHAAEQAVLVQP